MSTIDATEFRRRFRVALLWMAFGMGIAVAAIILILKGTAARFEWPLIAVASFGTAVMYGAISWADQTKCPGCAGRVGLRANPYRLTGRAHHHCAACGIVFDEQSP
jgi:hypothetical protein